MSTNEHESQQGPPTDPRLEQGTKSGKSGSGRTLRTAVIIIGALLILGASFRLLAVGGEGQAAQTVPTTAVKRGQLVVSVTEGGTLNALESLEVKSEVEGNNQILEIVDEGTVITREDVENGKVLVRLDVSDLEEREADREISFQNAEASYVQAKENYDIQVKQNTSNVNSARLEVKFARMELERYLGSELAARLLAEEEQEDFDFGLLQGMAQQLVEGILQEEATRAALRDVYQEEPPQSELQLGGVAQQTLRDLSSELQLAVQEHERAKDTLTWTERLAEKQYVSGNQLTADRLSANRAEVQVESAQEELRLFIRYTLPKEAETRWSDYGEAQLSLDRVEARARSELAQAEATLNSRQRTYELEQERLEKTKEMIEKSTIRATKPGVVVYASTTDPRRYRNNPIEEGTSIRQNETIISVPNLETLAARVNIHETDIAKIKEGQKARISVEALEGGEFPGEVARISPMASSEHRWLNPDVMVYETEVRLTEVPEGLTPGMSATAEIIIAELEDALYVPLQAVNTYRGDRVCWVVTPDGPQRRVLETGYFTDKYVEIRDGLRAGEQIYLAPPEEMEEEMEDIEAVTPEQAEEEVTDGGEAVEQAEQPESSGQEDSEVDVQALLRQMEGMSGEERREFIQNLSEEERSQLMEQFRRSGGGRGGPGGQWGGSRGGSQGEGGESGGDS
ncbi:MAG: efflux RND transporter periplasmic adaptor subunit [Candidatus Brocadiia bacterium]